MIDTPPVEIHVVHHCNLKCFGCNHYCDCGPDEWFISIDEFEEWIKLWSCRINPSTFNILGGEPTLHPNLCDLLLLADKYFKIGKFDDIGRESAVCLITNGSFLDHHPSIKNILIDKQIRLFLSVHTHTPKFDETIDMVRQWQGEGVPVTIYDYAVHKEWRKFYQGKDDTMEPFDDNDAYLSWKNCIAKNYYQLFNGKIWKCANIAYLSLVKVSVSKWQKYLNYQALEPGDTEENIKLFFQKEHEDVCKMCPSNPTIL